MRTIACILAVSMLVPLAAQTRQGADAPAPLSLPVTSVALYKSGVAYFEHRGNVTGDQSLTVQFTAAQLDDVLKSLTTVDLGGGRVVGVTYDSPTPVERRLQGLNLPLGQRPTTLDVLGALGGARVQVRTGSGALYSGRLLNTQRRTRTDRGSASEIDEVTLVTDQGDILTLELESGGSVRVLDADLRRDLGAYLDVAASVRGSDARRLVIGTAGAGVRPFVVSYLSEAAVWKSTFRLVFPDDEDAKPVLQGWAIVDNVSAGDWRNVELSLIAGAPQSFVQPLSRPLFARRPAVALSTSLLPTPQLHDPTMAETVTVTGASPVVDATRAGGGIVAGASGGRGGGTGSGAGLGPGIGGGTAGGTYRPPPPAAPAGRQSGGLQQASAPPTASSSEVGDLFEYRLTDRVTVRRNESALVPILQAEVEAERVSLWNSAMGIRPRRAVWLTNSSDLTLDGGSVALIEAGAFAGEGLLDTLKPWERRLISYGADLGVLVNAKTEGRSGRLQRVHIANGMLRRESEQRESRTYTMRNQDRRPRAIVIEHPVRDGWKLAGNRPPVESTASAYRFQVGVPAGETAMLVVDEVRLDPMEVAITDVDGEFLSVALQGTDQQPAVERMLKPVFDERRAIAELTASIATRNSEITTIRTDQARLRENMAALQRSSRERRLLERYLRQLDEQETRLDTLKQEIARLTSQQQAAERRLADTIRTLELDLMF